VTACVLIALAIAGVARAGTFLTFGPEDFRPTNGSKKATIYNRTFATPDPSGSYTLRVVNGGGNGQFGRVSSCGIALNGALVVRPSEINQNVAAITKTIILRASNTLQIQVAGTAGTGVTVQIEGTDSDPPLISASAAPAANPDGWNNTDVTVTFTCSDARSGIVSCPGPVSVATEGANQVVSGTATDRAGNTASASVTVSLDRTPPTIMSSVSPASNGFGWQNVDVALTYTCTDGLSGVADCPLPGLVTTEGAGQFVSATVSDRAGNEAMTSTSINLDKTLPTINATAIPVPNGNGWNNTDVTVSFATADALSGVASPPSPVVVTADGGNQAVNASVTDRAGNTALAGVTVSLDKTPPTLNITAPTGTVTGDPAPTVQIEYSDATSGPQTGALQVSVDGAPLAGCSAGPALATCVPPNLLSGDHTVAASLADLAGNTASDIQDFSLVLAKILDIQINSPTTGLLTNTSSQQVSGTVSADTDTVVVNGVAATVQGGVFTASAVPLVEGDNTITAVATNAAGDAGTSSITVVRDTSPPTVVIESPAAGQIVTGPTVTLVGLVNDVVTGTVSAANCQVTVSGRAGTAMASVTNRTFIVEDYPAVPGPNTITVTGTDTAGNVSAPFVLQITRQVLVGQSIRKVTGDGQTGVVGTQLAQPLVVALVSATGDPVPGRLVTFEVSRGDGTLQGGASTGRTLSVQSDQSGRAQVLFTLGTRSGLGGQRVLASATGFAGHVEFMESATPGVATGIKPYDFDNLRGVAGRPLPTPFIVFVHDFAGNPVPSIPVNFQVVAGGGHIDGDPEATRFTDSDGRAQVTLTLGPDPGINNNIMQAAFEGQPGPPVTFAGSGLAIGPRSETRVSGVVLDNSNLPVPGVTMRILGTGLSTLTDEQGRFSLPDTPVATITLEADGSTATRPGVWPMLHFELTTISGADNTIGMPIYLLTIDTPNGQVVGGPEDVTLTMSNVDGLSLTVFADSVTCLDGSHQCLVSISQVHNDKVPMPPLSGAAPPLIWTVQPPGTRFDPPARISYPNVDALPSGAVTEVLSFDHDIGQYVSVGTATVSEDGSSITSDPGGGISHAGWGYPAPPPRPTTTVTNDIDGDGAPNVTLAEENRRGDILLKLDRDGQLVPKTEHLQSQIIFILDNIVAAWKESGLPKPVITSGNDDKHPGTPAPGTDCSTIELCRDTSDSLHYDDLAIDLRGKPDYLGSVDPERVLELLREQVIGIDQAGNKVQLKQLYDVQYERFSKPENNHFHVEYDPTGDPGT
jgi:hypothetical protein